MSVQSVPRFSDRALAKRGIETPDAPSPALRRLTCGRAWWPDWGGLARLPRGWWHCPRLDPFTPCAGRIRRTSAAPLARHVLHCQDATGPSESTKVGGAVRVASRRCHGSSAMRTGARPARRAAGVPPSRPPSAATPAVTADFSGDALGWRGIAGKTKRLPRKAGAAIRLALIAWESIKHGPVSG
jgi:hypothetical protein